MNNAHTSTYSAGSEDSQSQPMLPGMIPESSASKTTTAPKSSTDIGPVCQSSGTSGSSTEGNKGNSPVGQLTFSLAGSPDFANHSVKSGSREAQAMTVASGLKCSELLKKQDLISSLQRMLLESSRWHSTMCFLNWKAKGTPQGRLLFQLAPSTPRTDETECGLWPTPSTRNDRKPDPAAGGKRKSGTPAQTHLQDAVDQAKKMWPTPASRDYKGQNSPEHLAKTRGHHDQLPNAVALQGQTGSLNPTWVEWLMGYPLGHTDLNPSETP